MTKLIVCRGLPGSGKSTFARGWVAEDPTNRAEVNRDYLRDMLHDGAWIGGRAGTEGAVIAVRDAAIKTLLRKGVDVVCSDTNLPSRVARDLRNLADTTGSEFEVQDFTDVPLDVCLERDAEREDRYLIDRQGDGGVGEKVIRGMYDRYLAGKTYPLPIPEPAKREEVKGLPYVAKPGTPEAIIVDIDGTIALNKSGRSPFDWHRVGEDTPNKPVIDAVLESFFYAAELCDDLRIIFMSGRDESCRAETESWLCKHVPIAAQLFMRPAGDNRKDSVVKLELFDQHIRDHYTVRHVYDDRDQVIRMWRSLGLTAFQVAEGSF